MLPKSVLLFCLLPVMATCSDRVESGTAPAGAIIAASADHPVVVELFQSQGCSSCPPANTALNALAARKDVIALSFAVTYWDRLGWKDIFAHESFTQRQRDYAAALKNSQVYTPQVVLNGRRAIVGNGRGELAREVAATPPLDAGPSIVAENSMVMVGSGSGTADVWLVRYDTRTHEVAIKTGENGGRTLPHRNIVRELVRLGSWNGKALRLRLPAVSDKNYQSVILVQRPDMHQIISARRI